MAYLAYKTSHCPSANHNPELQRVICTGVTRFALVLHLKCPALSQSESSNFFMCSIKSSNNACTFGKISGNGDDASSSNPSLAVFT